MFAQREGDDTMPQIAEQREVLTCMLDPLCGTSADKDEDSTVRENLAEALLFLVTSSMCHNLPPFIQVTELSVALPRVQPSAITSLQPLPLVAAHTYVPAVPLVLGVECSQDHVEMLSKKEPGWFIQEK